jgi:perosamine synthetase
MRIGRTLPPAAAPIGWRPVGSALAGMAFPRWFLQNFETELRSYFGVDHVYLLSSGTAALTLTLRVIKSLSRRREVVIPAYTCFSVPAAVLHAGLVPVPCDVDPSTFDFDDTLVERALTPNTACVVAHHLFGIPSNVERLRRLCTPRGIVVVEDAAQAMGVESAGRKLGTVGDVGIFSVGRGKNITCGSGGIIVTSSGRLAEAIAREYRQVRAPNTMETLRDFFQILLLTIFIRPNLYWLPAALPFLRLGQTVYPRRVTVARLSGMKAGALRKWRQHLARSNRIRSATAAYFGERVPVRPAQSALHPYLRLPVLALSQGQKNRLYSRSQALGLGLSVAYPAPVSDIPAVRPFVNGRRFPAAERVAERLITLPTHHLLSETDKRAIADLLQTASSTP